MSEQFCVYADDVSVEDQLAAEQAFAETKEEAHQDKVWGYALGIPAAIFLVLAIWFWLYILPGHIRL